MLPVLFTPVFWLIRPQRIDVLAAVIGSAVTLLPTCGGVGSGWER